MLVAKEDDLCSAEYAGRLRDEIGDAVVYYEEIPYVGHNYFYSEAWTPKFLTLIEEALQYDLTDRRNLAQED